MGADNRLLLLPPLGDGVKDPQIIESSQKALIFAAALACSLAIATVLILVGLLTILDLAHASEQNQRRPKGVESVKIARTRHY